MRLLLLLAGMGLAACAPMAPAPEQLQPTQKPAETAAACAAQGGNWRPVCLMGKPACVIAFEDGGKACSDGSECASGRCVTEQHVQPEKPVKGVCARTSDPCGCMQFVRNGKADYPLCID
jgi:hypothetical protein